MQQHEAARDDFWLFAQAVEHLGYKRNVSTGRVVPLPPNADDSVATYKHRDTGQRICVWPIEVDEQAADVSTLADRHGFTFVQFGRPQPQINKHASTTAAVGRTGGYKPRESAPRTSPTAGTPLQVDDDRGAAGHRSRPDGTCPICGVRPIDVCNGGQVAGRTPAETKRAHHVGRLQALSTQASISWANAYTLGEHRVATIHQDDAEAFAAGAAALRQPPTQPFVDVLRALLRRDGPDADKPTCDLLAKADALLAEADRHG